jgi:choline/glycine/proline betaine transport protein
MEKSKQKKKKKRERTYERKAIEVARQHYDKQKQKAIQERRSFSGLQIVPTKSYYDDSRGHTPGEDNIVGYGFWVSQMFSSS